MTKKILANKWLLIVLIFAGLGLGLRIWSLSVSELFRDEAYSALVAQKTFLEMLTIIPHDSSVPFAFFVQHIFGEIFGYSEFFLRLPSLLFGIAGFIYFWKLLNLLKIKTSIKYVLLILISINPSLIHNSSEARFYSIFSALFVYQLYLITNILIKKRITLSDQIKFIITSLIGVYNHNLYWLVILGWMGAAIVYLWKEKYYKKEKITKGLKIILLPFLIIFICYIPWLNIFIEQFKRGGNGTWLPFDHFNTLILTLADIMYWPGGFNFNSFTPTTLLMFGLGNLAIALVAYAIIKANFNIRTKSIYLRFYSLLLVYFIAIFFLLSFKNPIFYIRYLAFIIPLYFILMGAGLGFLARKIRIAIFIILVGLAIFTEATVTYPTPTANASLTFAIDTINQIKTTNYLVVNKDALTYFNMEYYGGDDFKSYIYDKNLQTPFWVGKAVIPEERFITEIPYYHDQIFVVSDSGLNTDLTDELTQKGYTLKTEYSSYRGLKLYYYIKPD